MSAPVDPHASRNVPPVQLFLDPASERVLKELGTLLALSRDYSPDSRPKTRHEFEAAFSRWNAASVPPAIKKRATMISLSKGYDAAMGYLREEFSKEFPEFRQHSQVGRPPWYVHPNRRQKLAMGEIVARLLAAHADDLRAELTAQQRKQG